MFIIGIVIGDSLNIKASMTFFLSLISFVLCEWSVSVLIREPGYDKLQG